MITPISKEQADLLAQIVQKRFIYQTDRMNEWKRFYKHFRIKGYRNLPADKFDQACDFLRTQKGQEEKIDWLHVSPRYVNQEKLRLHDAKLLIIRVRSWAEQLPEDKRYDLQNAMDALILMMNFYYTMADDSLLSLANAAYRLERLAGRIKNE